MVGQLARKTQVVQCYYNCVVTYLIVKLLWLFHNAASSSETDISSDSLCFRTVNRKEWCKSGCQL
jgi:hypothetical protein